MDKLLIKPDYITKYKDTDYILADNLDDRSLLNLCIAQPSLKICTDENFWRGRLFKKYGEQEKTNNITWKKFYLRVVYYQEKYPYADLKTLLKVSGFTVKISQIPFETRNLVDSDTYKMVREYLDVDLAPKNYLYKFHIPEPLEKQVPAPATSLKKIAPATTLKKLAPAPKASPVPKKLAPAPTTPLKKLAPAPTTPLKKLAPAPTTPLKKLAPAPKTSPSLKVPAAPLKKLTPLKKLPPVKTSATAPTDKTEDQIYDELKVKLGEKIDLYENTQAKYRLTSAQRKNIFDQEETNLREAAKAKSYDISHINVRRYFHPY